MVILLPRYMLYCIHPSSLKDLSVAFSFVLKKKFVIVFLLVSLLWALVNFWFHVWLQEIWIPGYAGSDGLYN